MLRTLRIRFDPVEDRLILGLVIGAQSDAQEHVLALTRRLWKRVRRDLQAILDLSAEVPPQADPITRQALSTAHHHAVASQVPARTERAGPSAATPAADLVLDVHCGRRRSDRRWVLRFVRQHQPDLTLVLSDHTMHATVQALLRREVATAWDLPHIPAGQPESTPKSQALH